VARLELAPGIEVDEAELGWSYLAGTGPGGQNVNKVAAAAQLRFDTTASPGLPERVRERLRGVAGRRMTTAGVLVITANRFRTQAANRDDALARLRELVAAAATPPPPRRRPTRPTYGAKLRRLAGKSIRAGVKAGRARPPSGGDD
jgi:ribosome-associated protein